MKYLNPVSTNILWFIIVIVWIGRGGRGDRGGRTDNGRGRTGGRGRG